ncbi:MAG TPA: 8-amino-7-oxononanoate synthase [Candidatus Manganitrophaceae bacterium]|nr:8-amino-7-oxononanoate synthase [Candidatus Manganitrophaceae bacterium]
MWGIRKEMTALKAEGLFRSLTTVEGTQSTTIERDGKRFLLFCSNNYLGLANHPRLKAAAISAIKTGGVGAGASRLISGNSALYTRLETRLAEFKSTESALVFSSGYTANIGALCALAQKNDLILSDRLNHASLVDGARLSGALFRVYRHKDMAQLKKILSNRKKNQNALIVTDGIFSMEGDIAPLSEIFALAEDYGAFIYLDDAHATGVLGPQGRGTPAHFNLKSGRIIQMGTLSKAIGGVGGFIAGDNLLIQYLINKARPFIYTTALAPASLASALAALTLIEEESGLIQQLWKNTHYFRRKVLELGFNIGASETPIVPLLIGESEKAVTFSRKLLDHGIYIPAIRPPSVPKGSSRLRVSLMATHTQEEIDTLLSALEKLGKELRLI